MAAQRISGEVIWITGAGSGIGRELARQLAQAGNRVYASARNRSDLASLAAEQPGITALACDVTELASLQQAAQQIEEDGASLDRLILNAGTAAYLNIARPNWPALAAVMQVNYHGVVNTLQVALPLLHHSEQRRGHIVGISSLATELPLPRAEAYGASKAAVEYFLNALRVDLAQQCIDVTVIQPGFVKTPLTDKNDFPMPWLLTVEHAAARIIAAIGQRRRRSFFPRRLYYSLRLLGLSKALWYRWLGPAMMADKHKR